MGVILDGMSIHNREELHELLAQALGFPAWYGGNMDALFDCLSVLCLSPILLTRAYMTAVLVLILIKDLIEHRFTSVQLSVQDFFEHKLNLNTNHQPKKPLTRLTASTFVFITTSA